MIKAINSKILQKSFPEQYRRFFSENELVISTAPSFMWTGEYSAFYGGISICQKVPLRVYAGLKPFPDKEIVAKETCEVYIRSKDQFSFFALQEEEIKKINIFLNEQFGELIGKKGGCQITFLTETSEGENLNLLATICALISLELYLYYGLVEKNEIIGWQKLKVSQLRDNEAFQKIFNLAWQINRAARDGLSSGTNAFNALVDSGGFPIIYWTEKDLLKNESPAWFGERMTDVLDGSSLGWHFDFGLIQFGGWRPIGAAGAHLNWIERSEADLGQMKKDNYIKNLPFQEVDSLFAHYDKKESPWLTFMKALDLISLRILLNLKNVFQLGPSQQDFSLFLETLNQHRAFFNILGLDAPEFNTLLQIIQKLVKKDGQVGAKGEAYGLGQKGCLTFAVPKNSLIDKENVLEKEFKSSLGPDVYFSYLSWLDGIESEGIRIEQDLKNKIYSPLVGQEEMVRVREYDHSFQAVYRLLPRPQLDRQKEEIDLVLDKTRNQVYLQGKRLTSQKIRSARETIKIIDRLLAQKGELKNTDLPTSSYAANQYELSGKIILPLKRTLEEMLKKELYLTVQGKIYDFSLRFDPTNLKIWLVERPIS
jgi:hypothetical protein